MIFSIPRSKSFMEQFTYKKHMDIQLQSSQKFRNHQSPIRLRNNATKNHKLHNSQSETQNFNVAKYKQSPKKQLIYSKCKSKSFDKYLIENKKKVQKQIIMKNLNPEQKRIFEDSEENKKIYSGKKLVDPFHQKFNYFIQSRQILQNAPFVISDFLLEPCKIKSKRLESRPFTSQSFINADSQILDAKKAKHARAGSSMSRTYQKDWRGKSDSKRKMKQNLMEFSNELVSMGSKFHSKQFCVDPWELDPTSNNLDSIRIQ